MYQVVLIIELRVLSYVDYCIYLLSLLWDSSIINHIKVGYFMKTIKQKLQQFLRGRYGVDRLNKHLQYFFFIMLLLSVFTKNMVFYGLSILILVLLYFRTFSRQIYKRTQENLKYTRFLNKIKNFFKRIKDLPKYKYVRCPNCHQQLRVPRGKGNITITCSRCHTRFDAKS